MKNNDSLIKIRNLLYVELGSATLFSLLSLNFKFDISILAFLLSVIFTGLSIYFAFVKFLKEKDGRYIKVTQKMIEYLPFILFIAFILRRAGKNGTNYWYDLITVFLWLIVFVLSFVVSSFLQDKKAVVFAKSFKNNENIGKKYKGAKRVYIEAIEWIDAFAQTIYVVLILQIFLFQLYEIPSESMVPTFLVKDKVVVSKIDCGPKFPLTEVGLPDFRTYKRGDTIVLRNPHYSLDRKSEVKSVTSQLINMMTLLTVNLNRDEEGEIKADPLVKRIAGVPGEQLVMQDGTLYARTKDHDFMPVETDAKYAAWNLNSLSPQIKKKVLTFPLDKDEYEKMINFEEKRRNYDLTIAKFQAQELVNKFNKLAYKDNLSGKFEQSSLYCYDLFVSVQDITRRLMTQQGGTKWFSDFMTSWFNSYKDSRDIYEESNYKLNVMAKLTMGNLIVRYAELYRNNESASNWSKDSVLNENMEMAQDLFNYIINLDQRNMPVFPANDSNGNPQFIPNNCYFMMGDNRFNSYDLRHSNNQKMVKLTDSDYMSVEYYSMMGPQYINKKYIVGKPVYRILPFGRQGSLK